MEYEESVKNYNDWFAITQTSEKKGIEKGIRLTAKRMKDEGIELKTISKVTGLSEEEIKSL